MKSKFNIGDLVYWVSSGGIRYGYIQGIQANNYNTRSIFYQVGTVKDLIERELFLSVSDLISHLSSEKPLFTGDASKDPKLVI